VYKFDDNVEDDFSIGDEVVVFTAIMQGNKNKSNTMISKYFNPYTDFGFKKLFGEEASKELLVDFLNQLLPEYHQIKELTFKNPENMADTQEERKSIFDIYCISQISSILNSYKFLCLTNKKMNWKHISINGSIS